MGRICGIYPADTSPIIKRAAESIQAYINDRLSGNHWTIQIDHNLATGTCTELAETSGIVDVVQHGKQIRCTTNDGGQFLRPPLPTKQTINNFG